MYAPQGQNSRPDSGWALPGPRWREVAASCARSAAMRSGGTSGGTWIVMGSPRVRFDGLPKVHTPSNWPRLSMFRRFCEVHSGAFRGVWPRAFRRRATSPLVRP